MASEYTNFYLKELLPMIDKIALDSMKSPDTITIGKTDEQIYLLKNASIAFYNRGILKMREQLVTALTREEADPDG